MKMQGIIIHCYWCWWPGVGVAFIVSIVPIKDTKKARPLDNTESIKPAHISLSSNMDRSRISV
jgi:hypothetical protein